MDITNFIMGFVAGLLAGIGVSILFLLASIKAIPKKLEKDTMPPTYVKHKEELN